MIERIVTPRLADIIEAIERIRRVLDGVTLEAFEQSWEKRWLVERGIEVISEASRHLTDRHKGASNRGSVVGLATCSRSKTSTPKNICKRYRAKCAGAAVQDLYWEAFDKVASGSYI